MINDPLNENRDRGLRLTKLHNMTGLSGVALAKKSGFSRVSISNWERGNQILSRENADKLMAIFAEMGIRSDINWLWYGSGEEPQFVSKNEYRSEPKTTDPSYSVTKLSKEIDVFMNGHNNNVIAKIDDNLMEPFFEKGDIVGGVWKPITDIMHKQFCIIKFNNILIVRYIEKMEKIKAGVKITLPSSEKKDIFSFKEFHPKKAAPIIRLWR